MKKLLSAALVMMAAIAASAEGLPQAIGNDPLTRQILSKAAQENGGVTAAVRLGTGQTIELEFADVSAAPLSAATLAPAAESPLIALEPAAGIAAKASAKPKAKKPSRKAAVQLKDVSAKAGKSWDETR